MKKMIAIDGSSLLSSCYFATLPNSVKYSKTDEEKEMHYKEIMHSHDGTYTNGVYGSLKVIQGLIKNQNPDYMVVAFDVNRNTFRRELYPEYKAQRGKSQAPLKEQFKLFQEVLNEMGICTVSNPKFEADDYIASIVKQFDNPDLKIKIITKDQDYLQLPTDNTECWLMLDQMKKVDDMYKKYNLNNRKSEIPGKLFPYTKNIVKQETGVWPEQFAELKAIKGDSSDNYPGIKGIASAAVPLLQEYGSIENIYKAIDECENDNEKLHTLYVNLKKKYGIKRNPFPYLIAESTDENILGRDAAKLFKVIATMKTDIVLNLSLNDMICEWNLETLSNVCKKLDIKNI